MQWRFKMEQPKFGEFCWTELATPNVQAAKDFYGKTFGWKFVDHDMGNMTYTMIKMNDKKELGGIWSIPKDKQNEIPPHWMVYILVDNVDESLKKASQNGATILKSATDVADFGRMGIIIDPTGAHIALWQSLRQQ